MEKDTLKMEGSERRESEQLMKLMGAKKMEFVQRYLENVQETCSMTTEASDSGLGTLTVISEKGIEVVRGKTGLTVVSVVISYESMLTVTRYKYQVFHEKRKSVVNQSLMRQIASKFAFEEERSIFILICISILSYMQFKT